MAWQDRPLKAVVCAMEIQDTKEETEMNTMARKVGNVCIWCAIAGIGVLSVVTASVLVWVGMM